MAADPWAGLAGPIPPLPAWEGETRVHRLEGDPADLEPEPQTRCCRSCKLTLPLTEEFFYRHKSCKGGWRNVCKACFLLYPSMRRDPPTRRPGQLKAWLLLKPGSEVEAASRQVPPEAWWPFPDRNG